MLGAKGALESEGIHVDAEESRQFSTGVDIVSALPAKYKSVVVGLGTNGPFDTSDYDAMMRAADGRQVYWVTIQLPEQSRYAYEDTTNALIRARAASDKWSNDHVVDWNAASNGRDDLLCDDGYHVSCGGESAYAAVVSKALGL